MSFEDRLDAVIAVDEPGLFAAAVDGAGDNLPGERPSTPDPDSLPAQSLPADLIAYTILTRSHDGFDPLATQRRALYSYTSPLSDQATNPYPADVHGSVGGIPRPVAVAP